jgi:hypothetical protein
MNRRAALTAILAFPLAAARKPRIIWVYYSDGPNGAWWLPTWERCEVRGDRAIRMQGNGEFEMAHVMRNLWWIEERSNARLNAPTEPGSRCCPPRGLPSFT